MKINERTGKYFVCLLPFFELFTLEVLIARGVFSQPLSLLTMVLSGARLLISVYMIVKGFFRNVFSITHTTWGIFGFSLFRIISSIMNGSFNFGMIVAAVSYVGFVLFCETMIYESKDDFYKALFGLFGIFSILGVISIWLFPNGFFYAATKAEAVYFLGSKNSSFAYFLVFLFLTYIRNFEKKQKMLKYGGIIVVIFMLTETVCDSSNAVLCFIILLFFHLLIKYNKKVYEYCTPLLLELVVVFMGLAIILGSTSELLESVLNAIGRDLSFSGRNILWRQALNTIADNPFFGAGVNKSFILATGAVASHAHCFYLNTFAKYGIFCFGAIVGMITGVMAKLSKTGKSRFTIVTGVFVFLYLVHCITEDASIYVLSVVLLVAESMCIKENIRYIK